MKRIKLRVNELPLRRANRDADARAEADAQDAIDRATKASRDVLAALRDIDIGTCDGCERPTQLTPIDNGRALLCAECAAFAKKLEIESEPDTLRRFSGVELEPTKVVTLDDRARAITDELKPYVEDQRLAQRERVAIMLMLRGGEGLVLAFGSLPTEWLQINMRTDADGILLACGWRRVSGWSMTQGFETCDIEKDE